MPHVVVVVVAATAVVVVVVCLLHFTSLEFLHRLDAQAQLRLGSAQLSSGSLQFKLVCFGLFHQIYEQYLCVCACVCFWRGDTGS